MEDQLIFEWDEAKAAANLIKHEMTFDFASAVFVAEPRLDMDVTRLGQNEDRRKAVGLVNGRLLAVVYTLRNERVRIISARRANDRETAQYRDVCS
jgi:uncharacterized DUF497 family protein